MKAIVILGDGMADNPMAALGGKTPLEVANKPHIDRIAREGRTGLFSTIPTGMSLGSAVANLSVLGYDPRQVYQGRAVLEAASIGVDLSPTDVALRCNLISVADGKILSHSCGHLSNEEGAQLIRSLETELGGGRGACPVSFHVGLSYRHLLVLNGEWAGPEVDLAPPHDHLGESWEALLPRATAQTVQAVAATERLRDLMEKSASILAVHPVNRQRAAQGLKTADMIWPWSPGRRPTMSTFHERYGVKAAVISAVDLVMGLGIHAGMDLIRVPGATGLWDTNYEGKAQAALNALATHDLVYVHVEATDEASHAKDVDLKIKCIEMLDGRLVAPILAGLEKLGLEVCISILPDHPTCTVTGRHTGDPVPVAIWNPRLESDAATGYSEIQVRKGALGHLSGEQFIRLALGIAPF